MLSLHIILTIARYEAKILFRSWFFRIFSLISLVILVFLNVLFFAQPSMQWQFRGIASSIPYFNILLLNVAQAVIGVFTASDFFKYDRKLDTTDVVYMRSLTNADYIFGKTLGLLAVFGVLNLLALIVALVFNLFFADVPVVAEVYFLYPLLISVPTLFFIFGITFLLMSILRSQALTSIILLGYIAATLFFIGNKLHHLFDYMALGLPLLYSDFVGFGNLTEILVHRGIYFLLGLGFIFTTVLLFRRLPQSRPATAGCLVLAVFSLAGALVLGRMHLSRLDMGIMLREQMQAVNSELSRESAVSILSCDIDLDHGREEIRAAAAVTFANNTSENIDQYMFSLNPGLDITGVSRNGRQTGYTRDLHILTVKPESPLEPGAADSLKIFYQGRIDEKACYLDIEEEIREQSYRNFLYTADKRYGFITENFLLLTPETLWYPVAGIPAGAAYPRLPRMDFIRFSLRVKTAPSLRAVSQGAVSEKGNGEFVFSPELPLPRLSLAVGKYETLSVTVRDSITADTLECTLYLLEGHDYFSSYFPDLKEKLPGLINDLRNEYESNLELSYPYRRLTLLETPIQFCAYPRLWTLASETTQPEMVFLPENAVTLQRADFRRFSYFMSRQRQRGRGAAMTPEEIQSNMFRRFAQSTFLGESSQFQRIFRSLRRTQPGSISMRSLFSFLIPSNPGNYSIFPLYYSNVCNFSSDKWSIFNTAMEYYLNERINVAPPPFVRNLWGLSDEERANLALTEKSLAEILAAPPDREDLLDVLKVKCTYLFAFLQSELDRELFGDFVTEYLNSREFKDITVKEFLLEFETRFGLDLEPHFDSWLQEKKLPAFIITGLENSEVLDQEQTRYQVKFKVSNPEPVDGVVKVDFRAENRRGGGMMGFGDRTAEQENIRIIEVKAGQNKQVGIVLDDRPRAMNIDTYISQNLPSVLEQWLPEAELDENAEPFEGETVLDAAPVLVEQGAVVVDNEDPGFQVLSSETDSYLKRFFKLSDNGKDQYVGMQPWNMPRHWGATTYSGFYGKYRHSAHYIRAGSGDNKVSWQAELPSSGRYDVFCHATELRGPWRWGGRRGGRGGGGRRGDSPAQDFNFIVYHDDGAEEVKLDANSANEGWNLLGTFYFSKGAATIELSDRTKGRLVYADAIKWRLQK